MSNVIGKNLAIFRKANRFTQEQIASYLGIQRSAYSNYESGDREPSLDILEKAATLLGCNLSMFFEEDEKVVEHMLVGAFRVEDLSVADMQEVAAFKKVVMNYLKMDNLLKS